MPRKKSINRTAKGNGSIRKVTTTRNGREYVYWQARYTSGYDPGTGKQIQHSVSGKTQKEVAQKLKQITLEIDNGTFTAPSKLTIAEWMDIWLTDYCSDKKYMTMKTYRAQVKTHIKPRLGAVKLQELVPHVIQKFYNGLLENGKSTPKRDKKGAIVKKDGKTVYVTEPLSPKSVRNVHGILTKALSVAVNIGYLRENPAEKVTLPRMDKTEIVPLTDEQVNQFLKAAAFDPYEIMLKVILFTGLRESEALGLTWDCIDFKAGKIKVCKQLQKRLVKDGGMVFASLKNDRSRVLKPAPFVMALLERQHREQALQRLKAGDDWNGWINEEERKNALVFMTPQGKYVTPTIIRYHLKKLVESIGAPDCRVHDLRHTFAVLSLQIGDDIKTLQDNLGHATAAFTLDRYGHVSERMKDESAARMQAYIEAVQ